MSKTASPKLSDRQRRILYGKRVRHERTSRGLLQRQLAEQLGVTKAQVCNIENGVCWSAMPVYRRLCELFGLPVPPLME